MKRYYAISRNANPSPLFLMFSLGIALYIMLFINGFMGSLGGIPAAVGSFSMIYMLRGIVNDGNYLSHQLTMSSRSEVRYLFLNYALGYGIIWGIMRVLQVIARITGWGTIEGMSVYTYFHNLYGTSMLERWAYISTAILMFTFVISLFPIIVIHKKRVVLLYLLIDSLFFLGVTYAIRFAFKFFIRKSLRKRAKCVLDALLLSELPHGWQKTTFMVAIVVFFFVICVIVLKIAIHFHGPKPGRMKVDVNRFPVEVDDEEDFLRALQAINRRRKVTRIISGGVTAVAVVVVAVYLFTPPSSTTGYTKIAEFMTEDSILGPMIYGNDIYIPVNVELNYHEDGMAIGYIGKKGENCESRFYRLAIANLLYKVSGDTMLEMYGTDTGCYQMEKIVEQSEEWSKDTVFFLWDETWTSASASHKGNSGYSVLAEQFVRDLKAAFPKAELRKMDFSDYDAFFTIMGYENVNEPLNDNIVLSDWCGYILVKDNQFYYNNYDNLIDGELLEELKSVVGGNTNGGNPNSQISDTEVPATEAE